MNLADLKKRLSIPVIGAPLFIVSTPDLVIAQCKAGIVGAFPALNARPAEQLAVWLQRSTEALDAHDQANPDRPPRRSRSTRSSTSPTPGSNAISRSWCATRRRS